MSNYSTVLPLAGTRRGFDPRGGASGHHAPYRRLPTRLPTHSIFKRRSAWAAHPSRQASSTQPCIAAASSLTPELVGIQLHGASHLCRRQWLLLSSHVTPPALSVGGDWYGWLSRPRSTRGEATQGAAKPSRRPSPRGDRYRGDPTERPGTSPAGGGPHNVMGFDSPRGARHCPIDSHCPHERPTVQWSPLARVAGPRRTPNYGDVRDQPGQQARP
jgi:hypothetical protein